MPYPAAPLEDIAEEDEQQEEEEEEEGDMIGEEDEMADFIVDEEDVDETGAVVKYDIVLPFSTILHSWFSPPVP